MTVSKEIFEYHTRSKHHLDHYAPGPRHMDWATQPDPFRTYAGAPRIDLPLRAGSLSTRFSEVRRGVRPDPAPLDRDSVGTLLEISLGLSAWKSYRGTSWALRCNPSSGNLHPTEGYVVTGAIPGLEAGVYHYVSRDHALERRAVLADTQALADGVLVALTSIYWREAWKYGIRAFRYCQHDCGHAIAAVAYAAAALGWRTRVLHEPGDSDVAGLLGLGRDAGSTSAEQEEPDCLLWIGSTTPPSVEQLAQLGASAEWSGWANQLSPSHVAWRDIDAAHAATIKGRSVDASRFEAKGQPPARAPLLDRPATVIIRQRRSAVDFDGVTSITAEAFYTMLEPLVPRIGTPPWDAWPQATHVHLALFVHRVVGLEPGLYVFARDPDAVQQLKHAMRPEWLWRKSGPRDLSLHLLIADDVRDVARAVSCHQNIAADSCFAVAMLADFAVALREPWRYRALHWECGMIGQVLYLEAEAAGIRATGIGCFFDDALHQVLGLPTGAPGEWQTLYHFTSGGAIDDPRLTTLPPYPATRRS